MADDSVDLRERTEYRNAFRFAGQPRWFDFYNCRVVLPEQRLFFYTMPFVLSGTGLPDPSAAGLRVYDGGNGGLHGTRGGSRCAVERLDGRGMRASAERCDLRWSKPDMEDNVFDGRRIRVSGPTSRWDVSVVSFATDQEPEESDRRRYDIAEKLLLRRAPFIHRVPRMKGFASGTIEQDGVRYSFERGIVYQAKNHGHSFPDEWIWIHANSFPDAPDLAIEVACLRRGHDEMTLARVAVPGATRMLSSLTGDDVRASFDGQDYAFCAAAKDGSLELAGAGRHGEEVAFEFPAPQGGCFKSHECFVGALSVRLRGKDMTTDMAALAHARWLA